MRKNKKIVILTGVFLVILSIAACGQVKEDKTANINESSTNQQESNVQMVESEVSETKTAANDAEDNLNEMENNQECSILVIVDRYEDDMIVVRDSEDEDIIMYFSMKNAEVIEGDTPIASGDIVELTYKGVQGDDVGEYPGTAVKIVAESMMYK
ncbi:MAG: hypothetical protein K2O59_03085 [Lachnospiraceae bacterium]|nr:hypothetical protein [Lachnospiraceae bacterium]